MDKNEKLVLKVSATLMVVFLFLMLYAAMGKSLVLPTCVVDRRPFSQGRLIEKGNQRFELQMVAKMWSFEPSEIHIPTGATLDVYLSSLDVNHGFYVEKTNLNLMAVPGVVNYGKVTFSKPGTYRVICHEYCGLAHHQMVGHIIVGDTNSKTEKASGAKLFAEKGCIACHSTDGTRGVGPTLKNILGRKEQFTDLSTMTVDVAYIKESILDPNKKIVNGFTPAMPRLELSEEEVNTLVEYIVSLK